MSFVAVSIGVLVLGMVSLERASAATNGPQNFTNSAVADAAARHVGESRPTGWNKPGECIKWVQSWVGEAGGSMAGGGPITAYRNSPATQISTSEITKGDVGQISKGDTYDGSPHTWVFASTRYSDGTYDIIEGNYDPRNAPGKVRKIRRSVTVPASHEYRVWRFGKLPGQPPPTPPPSSVVSIRSAASGKYVSAELGYSGGSYGMLRARAASVQGWERFRLVGDCRSACAIQSAASGKYVSAELGYSGGSYGVLRARAASVQGWERFRLASA